MNTTVGVLFVVVFVGVLLYAKLKKSSPLDGADLSTPVTGPFGTDSDPGDENDKRI